MTNNSKQSKQLNIFLKDLTNRKLYPNPIYMLNTCWNFKSCALYDGWRDVVDSFTLLKHFVSLNTILCNIHETILAVKRALKISVSPL